MKNNYHFTVKVYSRIFRSNQIICYYGKHNCQSKTNEKEQSYKLFILHVFTPILPALLIKPKREKEDGAEQSQRRPKKKRPQHRQIKNVCCSQNTVKSGQQYIHDKKIR